MTAKPTLEQKRQRVLQDVEHALEDRTAIYQQIAQALGEEFLTTERQTDRLVAVMTAHPYWVEDLQQAQEELDDAMRKAVRAGFVGDPSVQEWVMMDRIFNHSQVLRTLHEDFPDLARGMQKPIPVEDMALAMSWCDLKRAGKTDGEIFQSVKARRKKGELPPRKQNSSEVLRQWAHAHHLPELLKMEPKKLEQMQPMVEQLVERDASLQETLEAFEPALTTRYPLCQPNRAMGHIIRDLMASADVTKTQFEAFANQFVNALSGVERLDDSKRADLVTDLAYACAEVRETGQAEVIFKVLRAWKGMTSVFWDAESYDHAGGEDART